MTNVNLTPGPERQVNIRLNAIAQATRLAILAVVVIATAGQLRGAIVIEYSEDGSDLLLEFSGSFDFDRSRGTDPLSGPWAAIGNQQNQNSVFYSSPNGHSFWGSFSVLSATADSFWIAVYDYEDMVALGDDLMFRYNSSKVTPDLQLSGNDYVAGTQLSGSLRAAGHSIASSGLSDWSVDFVSPTGNTETITIQARAVPEPSSLALLCMGACVVGLRAARRRRQKPVAA